MTNEEAGAKKPVDLENSSTMLLRGAYLSMHRYFHAHCTRLAGVTIDQYVLMNFVAEHEGITQKMLGQRTFSDRNATTNMLKLLDKRKLVVRRPDTRDRRAMRVYLTAKGRKLKALIDEANAQLDPGLWALMDTANIEPVMVWLRAVIAAFSTDYEQKRNRPAKRAGAVAR